MVCLPRYRIAVTARIRRRERPDAAQSYLPLHSIVINLIYFERIDAMRLASWGNDVAQFGGKRKLLTGVRRRDDVDGAGAGLRDDDAGDGGIRALAKRDKKDRRGERKGC